MGEDDREDGRREGSSMSEFKLATDEEAEEAFKNLVPSRKHVPITPEEEARVARMLEERGIPNTKRKTGRPPGRVSKTAETRERDRQFGEKIRAARLAKRLSLRDVARMIGASSYQSVLNLEKGRGVPNFWTMIAVMEALGFEFEFKLAEPKPMRLVHPPKEEKIE
jgi:DNA-binding XRE family transcriptional regulator